MTNNKNLEM